MKRVTEEILKGLELQYGATAWAMIEAHEDYQRVVREIEEAVDSGDERAVQLAAQSLRVVQASAVYGMHRGIQEKAEFMLATFARLVWAVAT